MNDSRSEITDLNIERLLSRAYNPEAPDSAFMRRVQERMQATATTAAHARPAVPFVKPAAEPQKLGKLRFRLALGMGLAAAAALVAIVYHGLHLKNNGGDEAKNTTPPEYSGEGYLIAKRRPEPAQAPEKAVPGQTLETKAGQRQRRVLPDGSVLFINQNTIVKFDQERRLRLEAGEVFVEVAPRGKDQPFVIQTGAREVMAIGTKFAVRADKQGKGGVVVTQGKVKVGAVEIGAGQQLQLDATASEPAPRASAVLDWTRELMAAAESPLVPDSKYTGGALVAVDPEGQEAKLTMRNYKVDVHIEDGFARTVIDQTYFNHNPWRMEGTFYFPLPADAQLSRLAMYVDGVLMEGGMAERDYARGVYEEIVFSQKDPALLEWVDGSTFKMRVFPLEARQEKRLIIGYTQRLSSLYGRGQYRFPAGHSLGLVRDWGLNIRVKNGATLGWSCDSHALKFKTEEQDLVLTSHEFSTKLDRDVVVEFIDAIKPAAKDHTQFSSALHDGNRYVMLRYRPELAVRQQRQQRDWVFLFESSGDRDPLLARVQIDVIRTLLANAEHYDTFAIVTAGTRVGTFRSTPVLATPENIQAGIEYLESAHLIGALDLNKALTACEPLLKAGNSPHLVHVGTGVAAMGERRADVLTQRIPKGARYVGVGVGRKWDRAFMKTAAEGTGGYFTQINPDEPVSWRAFELSATLNTPRLMNVAVASGSMKPWLAFGNTLVQGEELCAVARFAPTEPMPTSVKVTGLLNGAPYEQTIPLDGEAASGGKDGAGYLPRFWARLEIDRLLAENSAENRERVIDLSKQMYVMSPYTSLLVLENEDMYKRFKVDRGRKDHWAPYVTPVKIPVLYEPEIGQPVDVRFAPKTAKPHANQVLDTIQVRVAPSILTWPGRHERYHGQVALNARSIYEQAFAAPMAGDSEGGQGGGWGNGMDRGGDFSPAMNAPGPQVDLLSLSDVSKSVVTRGESAFDKFDDRQSINGRLLRQEGAAKSAADFRGYRQNRLEGRRGSTRLTGANAAPGKFAFGSKELNDGLLEVDAIRKDLGRDRQDKPMSGLAVANFKKLKDQMDEGRKNQKGEYQYDGAEALLALLVSGRSEGPRMYGRPSFSHQERVFFDLAAYAPGMTTSQADVRAVVEAEAMPDKSGLPGVVSDAARKLIDRARTAGWRTVTVGTGDNSYVIAFDGQGRYAYERTLPLGLKEQVVCDGTTLLHLYPELGIGARRPMSRFHRQSLSDVVPWQLPPTEDLARGAELRTAGDRSVVIVPRDAEDAKDHDGKPMPYACHVLHFADAGHLAERHIVEMPGGKFDAAQAKVLFRETYDVAGGKIRLTDDKGEEISKRELQLRDAAEANLKPETASLVVLPLPYRQVYTTYQRQKVDRGLLYNRSMNWTLEYLEPEQALALLAAEFGSNDGGNVRQLYQLCFSANGDKKLGYFTLMASCGLQVSSHPDMVAHVADNPSDPLVGFLALHANPTYRKLHQSWGLHAGSGIGPKGTFLQKLSAFRDLYLRWHNSNANSNGEATRRAEELRALDYVKQNKNVFGWALLSMLQDHANNQQFHRDIAAACKTFEDGSSVSYAAQYEHGRSLLHGGRALEAADHFTALYQKMLKEGMLPPIDYAFRQALQADEKTDRWTALMRQTADHLQKEKLRTAQVALAWQCYQLGDVPQSENLVAAALRQPKDDAERLQVTLVAIEFLVGTSQFEKADSLLTPLLADAKFSNLPMLWRLGSQIAQRRGQTAATITRLEKALDLEYQKLPEVINLQQVRNDYGQLLNHYQWLAGAVDTMKIAPPKDLLARTIRAADRWRALDRDSAQPCDYAARILRTLGAREMAWDYLTTPIGSRPNESGPWQGLGNTLTREGDLDLADLAYQAAFAAEPTDANILWEQAQNLRRAGKLSEAHQLLRKIADGSWQPRFNWLKSQAKWQLEGR